VAALVLPPALTLVKVNMTTHISRRQALLSTAAAFALAPWAARAQRAAGPSTGMGAAAPARAAAQTDWLGYGNDLASTRYAGLDQINASNFNNLEVAWRFKTDNFGPRKDSYFNATPTVVKGRMYGTVGLERYLVCLDAGTGQIIWTYRHDEKGRLGARGGSGWGVGYWTDGTVERILYVTRSYQLISIDTRTGLPDPAFGTGNEVDLRLDWDHDVDPKAPVVGLHAPPLIVRNTVVVGTASSSTGPGYLRGFDVRTGKRKWIFHTVPKKGEFGYDTWIKAGQAETATNTGVWAMMSADPDLGLVYAGVELPQADWLGVTRHGDALFTETLVALDIETGERRWHYQTEHHGVWDRDIPAAPVLMDLRQGSKVVKALALPTKQAFLFVLDRVTGKPIWPIREVKVPAGDVPGEYYSPTQPVPTKPPAFDRQGFTADDVIDWTPELKKRALEIISHYRLGPLYTPPTMVKPDGLWGTLSTPENQGGANWPGGACDPETGVFYVYSKSNLQTFGSIQQPDGRIVASGSTGRGTNDNMGGSFGGIANPGGRSGLGGPVAPNTKDGLNDPIVKDLLTINGMSILKPPYGRITALDLNQGTKLWQVAHGETPDFIKNNPLLKGVTIPRTGQAGILGVLVTKSLVVCGDGGLFTDEQGRKAARLRAYDKATGREVGAVFLDQAQTGSPMTYMHGGRQHIVVASGGYEGGEFICYRLPASAAATPAGAPPRAEAPRPPITD
jgi:quinoprotein glucose dehydrogenase